MNPKMQQYQQCRIQSKNSLIWNSTQTQVSRKHNLKECFQGKSYQINVNKKDEQTMQKIFAIVFSALEKNQTITFSLIFSNQMKQINAIQLQHPSNKFKQFSFEEDQNLHLCIRKLNKIINQTGFSSEFKPFRLISKSQTQFLYQVTQIFDGSRKLISARPKNSRFYSNFQQELKILRKVNHPNVIQATSFYQSSSSFYIVYSHSIQKSVRNWIIERQGLSTVESNIVIQQILKGLQYLHSKNIRHGNISLQTIFVEQGKFPKVKIGNFSEARILQIKQLDRSTQLQNLEQAKTTTKIWLQQNFQLYDDIVSLGNTILSMAKLQSLYQEKNGGRSIIKHYDSDQQYLESITIPEYLKKFLKAVFTENKDLNQEILALKKELSIHEFGDLKNRKSSQNTSSQY